MVEKIGQTNMLRAIFEPVVPVFEMFTITGTLNNTTAMETTATIPRMRQTIHVQYHLCEIIKVRL